MQHLIKDGVAVESDPWTVFAADDAQGLPESALLPVSFWQQHGIELQDSSLPFGAYVQEHDDIDALSPFLNQIRVIAFEFAKFADGRAFTYARLLRDVHGFTGEIRAFGDFMPDQVNYLRRCGFNAFAARSAEEKNTILNIQQPFTVQYQSDAVEKQPLYRRR